MPVAGTVLLDLAVILMAAQAGGALARRLSQPPVIGELAAGVVLGPTVLGALPGDPSSALFPGDAMAVVSLIGQLGLVLFMFWVGWELDTGQPFPPIAIAHGTYDPIIPIEFAHRSVALLEQAGAEVLYRESPMQHSIDPRVIEELRPWLRVAVQG